VRERGIARASAKRPKFSTRAIPAQRSYSSVLKVKRDGGQDLIPACYVRAYTNKVKEALRVEEVASLPYELLPPGDGSVISRLSDSLRLFKLTRNADRNPGTFEASADYVSLV